MNIVYYTQHVLGIGHVFRSLALAAALAPDPVHVVTGGPDVPMRLPGNVVHHPMAALKMDRDFQRVQAVDEKADLDAIWAERTHALLSLLASVCPDVLLIEMFPFGRKQFARELEPLLRANAQRQERAVVVCSVRDILVEKASPAAFEERVLRWLRPWFDGVLVHGDAAVIPLERTFDRVPDIPCPLWYTGYVAERPAFTSRAEARHALGWAEEELHIVVSAGSGAVGEEVVRAALLASNLLHADTEHTLHVFTGPHAPESVRAELAAIAQGQEHVRMHVFTSRFLDYVQACDLSMSMAGYNTTMNVLVCGTRGLLYPFDQNREQRMRLTALADRGLVGMLNKTDLEPVRLAQRMREALAQPAPQVDIALDGDVRGAEIMRRIMAARGKAGSTFAGGGA